MSKDGWIAVDLDATLAHYEGWRSVEHIGEPIPLMADRVRKWLEEGKDVRIFTARIDGGTVALNMGNEAGKQFQNKEYVRKIIQDWTEKHFGVRLPVTNEKDYGMLECWDDRAVQVIPNTGVRADSKDAIPDASISVPVEGGEYRVNDAFVRKGDSQTEARWIILNDNGPVEATFHDESSAHVVKGFLTSLSRQLAEAKENYMPAGELVKATAEVESLKPQNAQLTKELAKAKATAEEIANKQAGTREWLSERGYINDGEQLNDAIRRTITHLEDSNTRVERLKGEKEKLAEWARECARNSFEGYDMDGATIQEEMTNHGLLVKTTIKADTDRSDIINGEEMEVGDAYYIFSDIIKHDQALSGSDVVGDVCTTKPDLRLCGSSGAQSEPQDV